MNIVDLSVRVDSLCARANSPTGLDNEELHIDEDTLHVDVLRAIADGSTDPTSRVLARKALETTTLKFERWYA